MAGNASERFVWAIDTMEVRPTDRLREGGFSLDRVLVEDLRPVPAVCAMGHLSGICGDDIAAADA